MSEQILHKSSDPTNLFTSSEPPLREPEDLPPPSIHLAPNLLRSTIWRMPDSRLRVWIHLLLRAATTDHEIRVSGRKFVVRRGDVIALEQDLVDEAGISLATYRKALGELEADDGARLRVNRKIGRGRVQIRLLNYDQYQVPCVGTHLSEPRKAPTTPREHTPRQGAVAWADDKQSLASGRNRAAMAHVARLVSKGVPRREALMQGIGIEWSGAPPGDWLGMYDLYFAKCFGFRSAEIVQAKKHDLTARIPRIARMLTVFRTWAKPPSESPEGLMADYLAWVFRGETVKTEHVQSLGGKVRTPITLNECFDPNALNRWQASRSVTRSQSRQL